MINAQCSICIWDSFQQLIIVHWSLNIDPYKRKKRSTLNVQYHLSNKKKASPEAFHRMVVCRLSNHPCNYFAVGFLALGTKAHYLQVIQFTRHQTINLTSGFGAHHLWPHRQCGVGSVAVPLSQCSIGSRCWRNQLPADAIFHRNNRRAKHTWLGGLTQRITAIG